MPPQPKPHYSVLSECASIMATLVEQMKQVSNTQLKIVDTVWGNGKKGVIDIAETNQRDIASLIQLIKGFIPS